MEGTVKVNIISKKEYENSKLDFDKDLVQLKKS